MFNFGRTVLDWLTGNQTVDTHNSGRQREEQPCENSRRQREERPWENSWRQREEQPWENSWGQREEQLQLFFSPSGAYIQADLARKTCYGEDNHPCNTDYSSVDKPCTVEPRFNEPLYNEVLGITNDIFQPSNSVMYGKEPRYNETSI